MVRAERAPGPASIHPTRRQRAWGYRSFTLRQASAYSATPLASISRDTSRKEGSGGRGVGAKCSVSTPDPLISTALVGSSRMRAVSYTHLRAHETVLDLVCRLLLAQ